MQEFLKIVSNTNKSTDNHFQLVQQLYLLINLYNFIG